MRKFSFSAFINKLSKQSMSYIFEDDSISKEQFNVALNIFMVVENNKRKQETNTKYSYHNYYNCNFFRKEDFCALITHMHFSSENLLEILPHLRGTSLGILKILRKDLAELHSSKIENQMRQSQQHTTLNWEGQKTCSYKRRSTKRDKFLKDCEQALAQVNNLQGGDLLLLLVDPNDLTREVGIMLKKKI